MSWEDLGSAVEPGEPFSPAKCISRLRIPGVNANVFFIMADLLQGYLGHYRRGKIDLRDMRMD